MAATKRNTAGLLASAVPRATLNDEELVRIPPLTRCPFTGVIVISRVVYPTIVIAVPATNAIFLNESFEKRSRVFKPQSRLQIFPVITITLDGFRTYSTRYSNVSRDL